MLEVIIENKYGETLNLSSNKNYVLTQVTGITPPTATINTATVATKDGSVFNSSRLENRNIVLYIKPECNIEKSRINIYKYIKVKQPLKMYFKNASRDVYISGYVESIDGDLYENPQMLQVSVICPNPYFKSRDVEVIKFSNIVNAFSFPFAIAEAGVPISETSAFTEQNIYNASDEDTGALFTLTATGDVLNITIYNQTTGESFKINYAMLNGDQIVINTKRGEKSIKYISDGVEKNIINRVDRSSKWFTLQAGDNIFSYVCDSGAENLTISVELQLIYEGV